MTTRSVSQPGEELTDYMSLWQQPGRPPGAGRTNGSDRRKEMKPRSYHHLSLVTRFYLGLRMTRIRSTRHGPRQMVPSRYDQDCSKPAMPAYRDWQLRPDFLQTWNCPIDGMTFSDATMSMLSTNITATKSELKSLEANSPRFPGTRPSFLSDSGDKSCQHPSEIGLQISQTKDKKPTAKANKSSTIGETVSEHSPEDPGSTRRSAISPKDVITGLNGRQRPECGNFTTNGPHFDSSCEAGKNIQVSNLKPAVSSQWKKSGPRVQRCFEIKTDTTVFDSQPVRIDLNEAFVASSPQGKMLVPPKSHSFNCATAAPWPSQVHNREMQLNSRAIPAAPLYPSEMSGAPHDASSIKLSSGDMLLSEVETSIEERKEKSLQEQTEEVLSDQNVDSILFRLQISDRCLHIRSKEFNSFAHKRNTNDTSSQNYSVDKSIGRPSVNCRVSPAAPDLNKDSLANAHGQSEESSLEQYTAITCKCHHVSSFTTTFPPPPRHENASGICWSSSFTGFHQPGINRAKFTKTTMAYVYAATGTYGHPCFCNAATNTGLAMLRDKDGATSDPKQLPAALPESNQTATFTPDIFKACTEKSVNTEPTKTSEGISGHLRVATFGSNTPVFVHARPEAKSSNSGKHHPSSSKYASDAGSATFLPDRDASVLFDLNTTRYKQAPVVVLKDKNPYKHERSSKVPEPKANPLVADVVFQCNKPGTDKRHGQILTQNRKYTSAMHPCHVAASEYSAGKHPGDQNQLQNKESIQTSVHLQRQQHAACSKVHSTTTKSAEDAAATTQQFKTDAGKDIKSVAKVIMKKLSFAKTANICSKKTWPVASKEVNLALPAVFCEKTNSENSKDNNADLQSQNVECNFAQEKCEMKNSHCAHDDMSHKGEIPNVISSFTPKMSKHNSSTPMVPVLSSSVSLPLVLYNGHMVYLARNTSPNVAILPTRKNEYVSYPTDYITRNSLAFPVAGVIDSHGVNKCPTQKPMFATPASDLLSSVAKTPLPALHRSQQENRQTDLCSGSLTNSSLSAKAKTVPPEGSPPAVMQSQIFGPTGEVPNPASVDQRCSKDHIYDKPATKTSKLVASCYVKHLKTDSGKVSVPNGEHAEEAINVSFPVLSNCDLNSFPACSKRGRKRKRPIAGPAAGENNLTFDHMGKSSSSSTSSTSTGSTGKSFKRDNICPLCCRMFTRSWLLKCHMRTHSGERPYQCSHPACDKAFADRSNLRSHMLIHSAAARNFACPKCGRTFSQKRYLHKHSMEVCRYTIRVPSPSLPS